MSTLHSPQSLPSQPEFLENGLVFTSTFSEDTTCSICTFPCKHDEEVVLIIPCDKCYFHKQCLNTWFTSRYRMRGTCPNDHRELFQPDCLIDVPIQAGDEDEQMTVYTADAFLSNVERRLETLRFVQDDAVERGGDVALWGLVEFYQEMLQEDLDIVQEALSSVDSELKDIREVFEDTIVHVERAINISRDLHVATVKANVLNSLSKLQVSFENIRRDNPDRVSAINELEPRARDFHTRLTNATGMGEVSDLLHSGSPIILQMANFGLKSIALNTPELADRPELSQEDSNILNAAEQPRQCLDGDLVLT